MQKRMFTKRGLNDPCVAAADRDRKAAGILLDPYPGRWTCDCEAAEVFYTRLPMARLSDRPAGRKAYPRGPKGEYGLIVAHRRLRRWLVSLT